MLLSSGEFIAPGGYGLGAGLGRVTFASAVVLMQQVLGQSVLLDRGGVLLIAASRFELFGSAAVVADFRDHLHLVFYFRVGERRHNLSSHLAWLLPMVSVPISLQSLLVLLLQKLKQEILIVLQGRWLAIRSRSGRERTTCHILIKHITIAAVLPSILFGRLAADLRDPRRSESA